MQTANLQTANEDGQAAAANPESAAQETVTMDAGKLLPQGISSEEMILEEMPSEEISPQGIHSQSSSEELSQIQNLAKELTALTGQEFPENADASKLLAFTGQLLQKGMAEHDTKLLRELLGNKNLQNIVNRNLQRLWTIKPEDVADSKRVDELD